jgi:hypothetical protein
MGKTVVFLPIIIFFGILFLLILGFFGVVAKLIKKSKATYWKGVLADKKHAQRRDFESNRLQDFYTLIFKTEEGKEIKVGVSQKDFEDWKIGDRAEKRKGELWPRKL